MSETPKPNPEQSRSPETPTTDTLDQTVNQIFADHEARTSEDADGIHEYLASDTTGTSLTRSTDQEGNVTYRATTLWHAITDRGSWTYEWSPKADALHISLHSEMEGRSTEEPGDASSIEATRKHLEHAFSAPVEAEPISKENVFKRFVGGIALRRAQRNEHKEVVRRANENLRAAGYTGRKIKGL